MRYWPRTFLLAVARKNFSALVLLPILLNGYPAKPCKSRRNSAPHYCSPAQTKQKNLAQGGTFLILLRGRDEILAKNIFTRRSSQKFLGPGFATHSAEWVPRKTLQIPTQ